MNPNQILDVVKCDKHRPDANRNKWVQGSINLYNKWKEICKLHNSMSLCTSGLWVHYITLKGSLAKLFFSHVLWTEAKNFAIKSCINWPCIITNVFTLKHMIGFVTSKHAFKNGLLNKVFEIPDHFFLSLVAEL